MVEWSKWAVSGSLGIDPGVSDGDATVVTVMQRPDLEYKKRIEEILNLAIRFDPASDAVVEISEILSDYENSGVLTKDEMVFLNRMYKLLAFEAKYHPDKETTIGRIKSLLGGLNA